MDANMHIAPPQSQFRRPSLDRWLPTPGNVLFTLLIVAGLFWAGNVGAFPLPGPRTPASSSTTISYQGRLANSNGGSLTTGGVTMVFSLYNLSTGGTALWSETQNTVPVSNGLFTVLLGSVTPIPSSVVTGNATLWLGVKVGTDTEMTPRQQVAGVPYAMSAQNALLAQSVPDLSISTPKLADGAVTRAKLGDSALIHSVSNNQIIQSGSIMMSATASDLVIPYLQPFANQPVVVITQREAAGGYAQVITSAVSNINFNVHKYSNSGCWIDWMAVGQ